MGRVTLEFWKRGYRNTGMRDLTSATGLNESSLYNSFGNKHALFMGALEVYQAQTSQRMAHYASKYGPREALEKTWTWLARRVAHPDHHGCMLMNAALEVGGEEPEVKRYVQEKYRELEAGLEELIRRGQDAGEISTTRTPAQLARFFVMTFQGLNASVALSPAEDEVRDIVETALSVLD